MKHKTRALSIAVAGLLGMGAAQAYDIAEIDNGLLVPRAIHNGAADTTAVGLLWSCEFDVDTDGGTVYWTFFDVNSEHVTDGQIPMTQNDRYAFVWANESGVGLEGMEGYLVFVADSDNDGALTVDDQSCLSGEAFHVTTADNDVAFVPTWPLSFGGFNDGAGVSDLTAMTRTTVTTGFAMATDGEPLFLMYSIGGGDTTEIVLWSADPIDGSHTVNIFDDEENRKSVNLELPNEELNVVDPSAIVGLPATFVNGFLQFFVPNINDEDGDGGNGMVSYSVIHSPAFGARQTIINPHID